MPVLMISTNADSLRGRSEIRNLRNITDVSTAPRLKHCLCDCSCSYVQLDPDICRGMAIFRSDLGFQHGSSSSPTDYVHSFRVQLPSSNASSIISTVMHSDYMGSLLRCPCSTDISVVRFPGVYKVGYTIQSALRRWQAV